jgi:hypothetical protein
MATYVAQANLLTDLFGLALQSYLPDFLTVLGCVGGNGSDCVDLEGTGRL